MKRIKKKDPVSGENLADKGPFCYVFDEDLRTISQKESAADSQNCGGRGDFVLIVPIVPHVRVSPLTNSAKIYTNPRAGQQLECGQRSNRALGPVSSKNTIVDSCNFHVLGQCTLNSHIERGLGTCPDGLGHRYG